MPLDNLFSIALRTGRYQRTAPTLGRFVATVAVAFAAGILAACEVPGVEKDDEISDNVLSLEVQNSDSQDSLPEYYPADNRIGRVATAVARSETYFAARREAEILEAQAEISATRWRDRVRALSTVETSVIIGRVATKLGHPVGQGTDAVLIETIENVAGPEIAEVVVEQSGDQGGKLPLCGHIRWDVGREGVFVLKPSSNGTTYSVVSRADDVGFGWAARIDGNTFALTNGGVLDRSTLLSLGDGL